MKTYVKGKKDNSKLIMRIGGYEFPVRSKTLIKNDCLPEINLINFSSMTIYFFASLGSRKLVQEAENIIKLGQYKTIQFCVNDDTTVTGEIVDCYSHLKHLYIYVRFVLNE